MPNDYTCKSRSVDQGRKPIDFRTGAGSRIPPRDETLEVCIAAGCKKLKLVVAYEEHVRELAAAPDMLKKVAPALQKEFADIAERFDAAMTENRRRFPLPMTRRKDS
jgi:hypothetical protein